MGEIAADADNGAAPATGAGPAGSTGGGEAEGVGSESGSCKASPKPHDLAAAIDAFIACARDVQESTRLLIPIVEQRWIELLEGAAENLEAASRQVANREGGERDRLLPGLFDSLRRVKRVMLGRSPWILRTSLFLGLFSAYDTFTGSVMAALYRRKPVLFGSLGRSVELASVLQMQSLDELRESVLQAEIDALRRKSYVEQFEHLEGLFKVRLRGFPRWPAFVECTQRRNLFTHCDGIVTEQYVGLCQKGGYQFQRPVAVGERLHLFPDYLLAACDLLTEVAAKLGQTLWRKVLPDEIEAADEHLSGAIYESLLLEEWGQAEMLSRFALDQRKLNDDRTRKVALINNAIAAKFGGRPEEVAGLLAAEDWTASLQEFRLAEAVLLDRYDDAAGIMKKLGPEGTLLQEGAYYEWPLFREFRKTRQFLETYQAIYSRPFVDEVACRAASAQAAVTEELGRREADAAAHADGDPTVL